MATIVDCPSCQRKLRVPDDLLGKKVKCPTCSGTFDAMSRPAPVPAPSASASIAPAPGSEAVSKSEPSSDAPSPVANAPGSEGGPVPASEQETLSQVAPK